MQKVIRRAEQAARYAEKKKAKKIALKEYGLEWERRQEQIRTRREVTSRLKQARINRQEDWQTGALAPRRDVGEQATTYGSISVYNIQRPDVDPSLWRRPFHMVKNDRVVITKGHDKGRIGIISSVDRKKGGVQVKDLNMIDVSIPKWMKKVNNETRDVQSVAQMIDMDDVKLVYPLLDPETGIHRDVIIERTHTVWDASSTRPRPYRAITGTNTIIPWPITPPKVEQEDNEGDTLRISVEEVTFRPTLIRAPMPMTVIDELRNKYSKFRTRHDYDYRVKKEGEDVASEARKGLIKTMRTPLQELAELRAQQKAAQAKELTSEQLAKIGEVIAQEQERTDAFAKALEQDRLQERSQSQ